MFNDLSHEAPAALEYDCPTCGTPMEVVDRFTLYGVPAPVDHVKVRCPSGHWFTLPVDGLTQAHSREEVSATSSAS